MSRPEYIRCIQRYSTPRCRKYLHGVWAFIDVDHAVTTVDHGGRQLPCPECIKAIIEKLSEIQ